MHITKPNRILFGLSIAGIGVLHLISDHFVISTPPQESFVGLAFIFGAFLYKSGLITLASAIIFGHRTKTASVVLGFLIMAWITFRHLPFLVIDITDPGELNSTAVAFAIAGGAFILAYSLQTGFHHHRSGDLVKKLAKLLYGLPLFVFGLQHIAYASFIASLIPIWIPGRFFLAIATGLAFIAAGSSITFEWKNKTGTFWLGLMISAWLPLVHIPRILSSPRDGYEWTNMFQAIAVAVSAFILWETLSRQSLAAPDKLKNRKVTYRVSAKVKKHPSARPAQLKDS